MQARARAADSGLAFVHPFDDPEVIAGQGGIGLELLAQVPDLERVIVPVGGGGLISGVATALKGRRPEVKVIGVQVDRAGTAMTIADGIAVKRPGELTGALIERLVDELLVVDEDDIAEAMVFLLERAKLVVEGAGAVGVAALLSGRIRLRGGGTTVVILSGGNVDAGLLAEVARRHESVAGRRLVLLARLPDRPGSLAQLLSLVADAGANLLDVQHIREGIDLHVRESAVQLVLETRGHDHALAVTDAIRRGRLSRARSAPLARGASVLARLGDERPDHAAALVGLRMPLHAEHELAPRCLDRLGEVVERRVAGDDQPAAELVDRLVVVGLGPVVGLARRARPRANRDRGERRGLSSRSCPGCGGVPRGRRGRARAGGACRPGRR